MRTTIRIDEELLREAKQLAARSRKSLNGVSEDALREALARRRLASIREPVRLITAGGNGLRPGVDRDDSASVLDVMGVPNDRD
jgi:predicted transcriptional regulator